mmetsp:Transcript_14620/g.18990  ORF Transcript_14620/g.18990 Transcript_14620/m.18990 type:complete len:331 (-) Transcript_14620:410-1402(-)
MNYIFNIVSFFLICPEVLSVMNGHDVATTFIVGERNSGTNWAEVVMAENFKVHSTPVFCQFKHWYQPICQHHIPHIVVILVRNPYDWASSFYTKPYNSPMHQNIDFSTFLRIQWALTNGNQPHSPNKIFHATYDDPVTHTIVAHDQGNISPPNNKYPAEGRCTPDKINPDIDKIPWLKNLPYQWCGKMPIYEANPINNTAHKNIFKMRASKLKNHFNIQKWSKAIVEIVSYDKIMEQDGGPGAWLEDFSKRHPHLRRKFPGEPFKTSDSTYKDEKRPFNALKHAHSQMYYQKCIKSPYSKSDFIFANNEIDWRVEKVAGYSKIPKTAHKC